MRFEPGPIWCGSIADGVGLDRDREGIWVISFADLERMYLAAKEVRRAS